MFLHQGKIALINAIDADMNVQYLKTVCNVEIPACSIVTILARKTSLHETPTPCVYKVQINEILTA